MKRSSSFPALRQDDRPPVTQDRMREILEQNSQRAWPTISNSEAAASKQPPRPTGQLEWAERLEGSMGRYSKCLWYSVCQVNHGEQKTFEAWTRNPLTQGMRMLECGLPTFRRAIEVCQKDADEHRARGDR